MKESFVNVIFFALFPNSLTAIVHNALLFGKVANYLTAYWQSIYNEVFF